MRFKPTVVQFSGLLLLGLALFSGCKKTRIDVDERLSPTPPFTTDRTQLTRDSIYLYALQTYYWNASLPTYETFNPRQYTTNDQEVFELTKFSKNTATGFNYEYVANAGYPKYSFVDDGSVASGVGGTAGDFGFLPAYAGDSDLRIRSVYPGSPADLQGIRRGYQILQINGRTDLTRTTANVNFISAAIAKSNASIALTLKKPDGSTFNATVAKATYTLNPVLYSNVYTSGGKKVGYFVYNSFTTNASAALTQLMAGFASQGISELIVDLRYNGGGSVATSELLANLIAPAAVNGQTMYDTYYNETMQNKKAVILKNQKFNQNGQQYSFFDYDFSVAGNKTNFQKAGSLAVSRVYFIVTGSTASASELLINNLKPVVDVKLIGRKTYGKPVGFFPIRIDKIDLYIPQFETKNKAGVGGYFDGIAVDKDDSDDVTRDFGDTSERLLAYALTYANKGAFSTLNPKEDVIRSAVQSAAAEEANRRLDGDPFKGMVRTLKIKK